jgi:hypothetical protein
VASFLTGVTRMVLQQSRRRANGGAWIAALLLLSSFLPTTYGQELPAPSGAGDATALPEITITGENLKRAVDRFIAEAMDFHGRSSEHPIARWRQPLCPLVSSLTRTKRQLVRDRLVNAWTSLALPLGKPGCRANFFVVVSARPEADLKAFWRHSGRIFGGAGAQSFIDTPRPVRIWYNTTLLDSDGSGGMYGGVPSEVPTYRGAALPDLEFSAVPAISSVIVVVDFNRVAGLDWRQVGDYIAMAGLTELKPDADLGEAPSILRLFTTSGDARPQRLSTWDKAFIKELYATNPVSRGQRFEIGQRMYRDLDAP